MSLINPFSVGAGLLLGGRAISDERKRMIARRQAEAAKSIRRYVDDATFQVGKDSKDMLRQVQRDLRDHFMGYAEQMNRSMKESLEAARAIGAEHHGRSQAPDRRDHVRAGADCDQLRTQVRTLLPAASRSAAAAPSTSRHSKDSALV